MLIGNMVFTSFDLVSGIMSIIAVIIATTAAILILSRYIKTKNRDYLLLGVTVPVLIEPWMPSAFSFIYALFNYGQGLPPPIYIFIGNAFIPLGITTWAMVFTDLILTNRQKSVVSLVAIFGIVFEINLLTCLFTGNDQLLGVLIGVSDIEYKFLLEAFLTIIVGYIFITGITFGIETLKADNPDLKLKGKLMIIGFSSFCAFAALDAIITFNEITLILIRSLGIFSAFCLYGGFLLPNWMKRLLKKDE